MSGSFADLIITNAAVHIMDHARTRARAIALGAGRIMAVGADPEIEALAGPETRRIDAGGRMLLPGFVESHLHLVLGGAEMEQLQLLGVMGEAALHAAIAAYGAAHPEMPILLAQGASYEILGRPVTRHDLDRLAGPRPFAMMSPDHHTVWANSAALAAAGLLQGADMPFGHVVVMGEDGLATGELREFEAFGPILALGGAAHLQLGIATGEEPDPWPSEEVIRADLEKVAKGLAHCAAHGITSMVNMDGNRYTLMLMQRLHDEGRLTARIKVPFHYKPHMGRAALERASALSRDYAGEWVSSGFVKLFMDGVIDSRTAFMLDDYPAHAGRGEALFPQEDFAEICCEIDRRGLQIAVHAIGDGAVRRVIDGYEAAARRNGKRDSRHRIEHIELIHPEDLPRLGPLGIIASVQPPHVPGAMDFSLSTMESHFHPNRWKDAYLARSLAQAGARLAFASDWPITDVSVLRGIGAAMARAPFAGAGEEALDLWTVVQAYTAGGAHAAHLDHLVGRLLPGMAADLVLIDGDLEGLSAAEIARSRIALTVSGGRIIYQAAGFA